MRAVPEPARAGGDRKGRGRAGVEGLGRLEAGSWSVWVEPGGVWDLLGRVRACGVGLGAGPPLAGRGRGAAGPGLPSVMAAVWSSGRLPRCVVSPAGRHSASLIFLHGSGGPRFHVLSVCSGGSTFRGGPVFAARPGDRGARVAGPAPCLAALVP